jgi:hypothetical protein
MADKLASAILRNAIVPASAPILPFQKFVDNIAYFIGLNATGTGEFLLNNKGIIKISGQLIADWLQLYGILNGSPIGGTSFDLRDNLINLTNLNTLLTELGTAIDGGHYDLYGSAVPIRLTGANMGTPPLPIFTIDLNPLTLNGDEVFYGACGAPSDGDHGSIIYAFAGGSGNLATSIIDWSRSVNNFLSLHLTTRQQNNRLSIG